MQARDAAITALGFGVIVDAFVATAYPQCQGALGIAALILTAGILAIVFTEVRELHE